MSEDMDRAVDEWIIYERVIDESIINNMVSSQQSWPQNRYYSKDGDEYSDEPSWEEDVKRLSGRAVFTIIVLTSIATLIIDPNMIFITLPISVIATLLYSMIKKNNKRKVKSRAIKPGEDEW